ncbi:MAG: carboxypeptidase regulatory-like domain-containing protein [Bacteroidales bacterium]|nr:carboxypeptidase regulatory-like domain-containing protein [Bacteroidales bacterium]
MIRKITAILAASLLSVLSFAQTGAGVKGTVVSRQGRVPVEGARMTVTPESGAATELTTPADGTFLVEGLPVGRLAIHVTADGFMDVDYNITLDGEFVRDIMFVTMTPAAQIQDVDAMNFAEFDMEDSGYSDAPTILFTSSDPFNNIAGYGFSQIRFKNRGYDSESQDVLLSGVKLNDALTGYSPYSLWTGLNEIMRSKDSSNGVDGSDCILGGFNGTTNIFANPSNVRPGLRMSVLSNSATYRLRLMATYSSGVLDNGWSYAFSASARLGGNDWIKGVYYRNFAYYAGVEKKFSNDSRLALFSFAAPGQRGAQNSSTQEVYDLMGDNMYNSNWGYQNGKVRNSRVRKTFEPVTVLKYTAKPSDKFESNTTILWRTGRNGYTALDWYDAFDPRPDYYRNLPSYAYMADEDYNRVNEAKADWLREAWTGRTPDYLNYQHLNWDALYNANYNSKDGRSHYAQEERRVDQNDLNFVETIRWKPAENLNVNAGASFRWNRTENYKILADLLGGEYFLNIDSFAERDFASDPVKIQNDLDYYLAHGEAQKIYKGDKYGYDYYADVRKAQLWARGNYIIGSLTANLGASIGYDTFWRTGMVRKGLFPGTGTSSLLESNGGDITSKGRSDVSRFLVYSAKAGVSYMVAPGHKLILNAGYFNDAPTFNQSFISPRTRNTLMDGLTTKKTASSDLSYQYTGNGYNIRLTGFWTRIKDQSDVMSFYDDTQNSFTNFAMTGIDQRHAGMELGAIVPLPVNGLSLSAAVSWGEYIYTSTPHMVQTVDNSAEIVRDEDVKYWQYSPKYLVAGYAENGAPIYDQAVNGDYKIESKTKHYVPSTPQFASELGLNYNRNYWFLELAAQYFANSYLDMNPLYRTGYACAGGDGIETPAEVEYMTAQEKFDPAFIMNASIGKSWYVHNNQIGFSLEISNFLNNRNVRTGGYEQTRLIKSENKDRYYRFDSKYFYMPGASYMLNIYFRF